MDFDVRIIRYIFFFQLEKVLFQRCRLLACEVEVSPPPLPPPNISYSVEKSQWVIESESAGSILTYGLLFFSGKLRENFGKKLQRFWRQKPSTPIYSTVFWMKRLLLLSINRYTQIVKGIILCLRAEGLDY